MLVDASEETLQAFRNVSLEIIPFVLNKALFSYLAGERKAAPFPAFFKADTREKIEQLRPQFTNPTMISELQLMLSDPQQFQERKKSCSAATQDALRKLQELTYEEAQGSIFTTYCWPRAIDMLPGPA